MLFPLPRMLFPSLFVKLMTVGPSDPPTFDYNLHEGRIISALHCGPNSQHTHAWHTVGVHEIFVQGVSENEQMR